MPAAPPISGDVCLSNLEPGPRPPPSLPPSSGLEASKITRVAVNLHSLPADSLSKGPTADPFAAPTKPRSSGSDPILTDLEKNLIAATIQPSSEMASLTFARRHSRPKRRESPILTRAQRRRVAVSSPPSLRSDLNPITSVVAVPSSPPPLLPLPACKPSSDVIAQATPSSLLQSTAPSPSQLTPPVCLLNSETLHSPSADLSSSPKAALTNSPPSPSKPNSETGLPSMGSEISPTEPTNMALISLGPENSPLQPTITKPLLSVTGRHLGLNISAQEISNTQPTSSFIPKPNSIFNSTHTNSPYLPSIDTQPISHQTISTSSPLSSHPIVTSNSTSPPLPSNPNATTSISTSLLPPHLSL